MSAENPHNNHTEGAAPGRVDLAIAAVETVAGGTLLLNGIKGIDSHEAQTPDDALFSLSSTYEIFVTPADIGFGLLAALGAAAIADGVRRLRRR